MQEITAAHEVILPAPPAEASKKNEAISGAMLSGLMGRLIAPSSSHPESVLGSVIAWPACFRGESGVAIGPLKPSPKAWHTELDLFLEVCSGALGMPDFSAIDLRFC
jgi:hypothetical protein